MDWSIPITRELVPGYGVPPVGVETAVREIGEFGEEVEDTFPDYVPGHHVFHHEGEDEIAQDPWEVGETFGEGEAGIFHFEGFDDDGVDEGLGAHVHDSQDTDNSDALFGNVVPIDRLGSGIFEFVDKGR